MTVYTTKATTVFGSGMIDWSWELDGHVSPTETGTADPAVQKSTQNVLQQFGAMPSS